jgi:hypothetical protein
MIAEHRGNYSSDTALAVAVAGKVGVGRETVRRWLDLPHPGKAGLPGRRAHLPVLDTGQPLTCDGRAHTVTVNVSAASQWFSVGAGLASSTVRVLEHGAVFGGRDIPCCGDHARLMLAPESPPSTRNPALMT